VANEIKDRIKREMLKLGWLSENCEEEFAGEIKRVLGLSSF
jgi:hypothetical protein